MAITDAFTRADAAPVTASPEGWSWGVVDGNAEIVSNNVTNVDTAKMSLRAESDLASTDHYAEGTLSMATSTLSFVGLAVRFAGAASTFYAGGFRINATDTFRLVKSVAGTLTTLANLSETAPVNGSQHLVRVEVSGDQLVLKYDGVTKLDITDASITTGTRAGLFTAAINGARRGKWHDFVAADLAVAVGQPMWLRSRHVPHMRIGRGGPVRIGG